MLVYLGETLILPPILIEAGPDSMNQIAFISKLDDVPWATSDQNPGLTYKLLIDASNTETDGLALGFCGWHPTHHFCRITMTLRKVTLFWREKA